MGMIHAGDYSRPRAVRPPARRRLRGPDFLTASTPRVVNRNRFVVIMVGTLPILAVYAFLQHYFIKGVMIGALKG